MEFICKFSINECAFSSPLMKRRDGYSQDTAPSYPIIGETGLNSMFLGQSNLISVSKFEKHASISIALDIGKSGHYLASATTPLF